MRRDALFCYNCGAAVIQPQAEAAAEPETVVPDAEPDRTDTVNAEETQEGAGDPVQKAAQVSKQRRPLTAAMLRRKKASNRAPVEIEWLPAEGETNLFLIVSLILSVIAIAIIAIALYLK